MDSGNEVYTPFPATVKCPPMAACVPSAFKNVPSSMLRSVSSSCRAAGLGLFCLVGKRLERATLCCLACLRMMAQVCLLSGALWTLLCCSGVSNATKPSTCVATAWAGWPCATRGIGDDLFGGATCTVFGTPMQPAGDGDAVLVVHLVLKQGIIWPDANCVWAGFPCSRNNISSYVADNCAKAGLQRGSDGVGVAVDPNKDLYDWPRHSRSDGFLISDFMCTQGICWCKDLGSMPDFTSGNRKIYPDLPKGVPYCAPRMHLDGLSTEPAANVDADSLWGSGSASLLRAWLIT